MFHLDVITSIYLEKKLNANFAHNKSSMKPLGFKNIILLYNLLLSEAFSLLVWYVSEKTTFKVVVLKQLKNDAFTLEGSFYFHYFTFVS